MAWPLYCGIGVVLAMLLVVWFTGFRVTAVLLTLCFALVFIYLRHFGIWTKIMDLSWSLANTESRESLEQPEQQPTAAAKYVSEGSSASRQRRKRSESTIKQTAARRNLEKQEQMKEEDEQEEAQTKHQRLMSVSYKQQKQGKQPQKQSASRLMAPATSGTFGSGLEKQHLSAYTTVVRSASALNESNQNILKDKNRRSLPSQAGLAAQNARTRGVVLPEPPSARKNLLTTMVRKRRRPRQSMYLVPVA